MRAERFGSYSISRTVAVTPYLFRLKSITRYIRLCPPPRRRMAMCPWLSRPPLFLSGSISERSGVERVISAKSDTERKRVPFVTGLNWRMPIVESALEDVDLVALAERHDRLFPVWLASRIPTSQAPRFTADVHGPHRGDLHAEQRFDRLANGGLPRVGCDLEDV